MKNSILYIFIILIAFVGCKSDTGNSNQESNDFSKDRFLMPSLPSDYKPKGLRKLSIIEMKNMVGDLGLDNGIVYKNNKGEPVSKNYYASGPEPRFVQLYVNSVGKIEEGVVIEMTPDLMAMMMLMRLATMTLED